MKRLTLFTIGLVALSITGCTNSTPTIEQEPKVEIEPQQSLIPEEEASVENTSEQLELESDDASTSAPKSEAEQEIKADSKLTAETPELVLRSFLKAMATKDLEALEKHCVANPDLSILAEGDELTKPQFKMMMAMAEEAPLQFLEVGSSFRLPTGKKVAVDATMVNDNRKLLTMPGNPIPFTILKVGDSWRVDAGSLIAVRKAAAKLREKMNAK